MENKQELIILEQLPVITEHLDKLSIEIKKKVDDANKLVCTEETVKGVKNTRSELNKEFAELEEQRKFVKSKIMEKYDAFEEVYKEKVSNLYKQADADLKAKIDMVENKLKQEKRYELVEFFLEQANSKNIQDYINFEDLGLNITLSASVKSLKEQILLKCNNVEKDLKLIDLEEFKEEILVEYHEIKDYSQAKINVYERHKKLEEIAKKEQESKIEKQKEKEIVEQIEEIVVPVLVEEAEQQLITLTFTVTSTKEKLKELKQYLIENNIEYR